MLAHFSEPQQAQQQQSVHTFSLCVHFQVQSLNNRHLGLAITVTTHLKHLVHGIPEDKVSVDVQLEPTIFNLYYFTFPILLRIVEHLVGGDFMHDEAWHGH